MGELVGIDRLVDACCLGLLIDDSAVLSPCHHF